MLNNPPRNESGGHDYRQAAPYTEDLAILSGTISIMFVFKGDNFLPNSAHSKDFLSPPSFLSHIFD